MNRTILPDSVGRRRSGRFLAHRGDAYPDVFGDVTGDARVFDRQRVADIVTGDV